MRVVAPVGVSRVEIVRDDPTAPVHAVTFDPPAWNPAPIFWQDEAPPDGTAYYYARVFLEGEHCAWSSPIWVEPP